MIQDKEKIKKSDKKTDNSGIYCILNKINGKRYVGQTYDFIYRLKRHAGDLKRNRHPNNHLQSSYNKHGADAFEYIIL